MRPTRDKNLNRDAELHRQADRRGFAEERDCLRGRIAPPQEAFERLARLACQLVDAPAAILGFRDEAKGWVQSFHGLRPEHQRRAAGWCALATARGYTDVVDDASTHPRFRYHSLVAGPPHVCSFVALPILDAGEQIGALCVLDTEVRPRLSPRVLAGLQDLAKLAADEINLRQTVSELETVRADFEAIFETIPDAVDRFPEDARQQYEQAVTRCLLEGASFDLELPLNGGGDVRRWARAKGKPRRRNGEIVGVTSFVQDITDRKHAEEIKREFVSVVSHELRTPLTSIHGTLGLLMGGAGGELPEAALPLVSMALRNSKRLARLIDDILDIDKIEAGKLEVHPQLIRVSDVIEDVVDANASYAQRFEVSVRAIIEDDSWHILVDPDKLEQILSNLISNAVKFSPPGAEVEVALRQNRVGDRDGNREGATEASARVGRDVRIEVVDHGDGIAEHFQERIFEKFAQADSSDTRRTAGTGLGLAIAKALTEQMGGRIDFESREGEGTTMFVEFPAADP